MPSHVYYVYPSSGTGTGLVPTYLPSFQHTTYTQSTDAHFVFVDSLVTLLSCLPFITRRRSFPFLTHAKWTAKVFFRVYPTGHQSQRI
jgi:hypothetical protein